jgi:hypothetical protein
MIDLALVTKFVEPVPSAGLHKTDYSIAGKVNTVFHTSGSGNFVV